MATLGTSFKIANGKGLGVERERPTASDVVPVQDMLTDGVRWASDWIERLGSDEPWLQGLGEIRWQMSASLAALSGPRTQPDSPG